MSKPQKIPGTPRPAEWLCCPCCFHFQEPPQEETYFDEDEFPDILCQACGAYFDAVVEVSIAWRTMKREKRLDNELAADRDEVAEYQKNDRDGPCYYCGEPTERFAGNPSRWPVYLCHADEPGVSKPHHAGCVSERLAENEPLRALGQEIANRLADARHQTPEQAIGAAIRERDAARGEVSEWKAAFDLDDHEGDSRLMATAMGQALKELRAEVDRLKAEAGK